jgi:hypothetical protein
MPWPYPPREAHPRADLAQLAKDKFKGTKMPKDLA